MPNALIQPVYSAWSDRVRGLQCVLKTDINMMALVTHSYWSIWKCFMLHIHWLLVFRYAKSDRNPCEEFLNILEFYKMGINYTMNLRPDFMQTNLLLFGCFHKDFTAHLFCKWPLCTLYNRLNASRLVRFQKTQRHVNKGKMQCWALFVISKASFTKQGLIKTLW